MGAEDCHRTSLISRVLALLISAFFAVVGVAGYQRTHDLKQLLLFLGLAVIAFFIVKFAFYGINRLLDSIDRR